MTSVEVRFEPVGDETRVTIQHTGWETLPQDHAARHHLPDVIFLRRHGGWQVLDATQSGDNHMSNRGIAHRPGVSEKAIRKLAGRSQLAEPAQLAFPAEPRATGGSPLTDLPSVTSSSDDAGAGSAVNRGVSDRDPIAAPVDDDEPVPTSLDRDASDRSFDRQLAHLGLINDAAFNKEWKVAVSRCEFNAQVRSASACYQSTLFRSRDGSGSGDQQHQSDQK